MPNAKKRKKTMWHRHYAVYRPSAILHSRHQPLKTHISRPLASSIMSIQPLEAQIPRMIAILWFWFIGMLSFHRCEIKVWTTKSNILNVSPHLHLSAAGRAHQTHRAIPQAYRCTSTNSHHRGGYINMCKGIKHKVKYSSAFRRNQL